MERLKNIAVWLFLVLFVASVLLNVRHYAMKPRAGTVSDTTRVVIVDTIHFHQPAPKEEKHIASITDRLPIAKPKDNNTPKNIPASDNNAMQNIPMFEELEKIDKRDSLQILPDSADVEIPITQSVYEDSTYRAVISGYHISLDEMTVYPRREVVTINNRQKPKRWSIGIQAGYGITPAGFQPYLGVGITCNLFSF